MPRLHLPLAIVGLVSMRVVARHAYSIEQQQYDDSWTELVGRFAWPIYIGLLVVAFVVRPRIPTGMSLEEKTLNVAPLLSVFTMMLSVWHCTEYASYLLRTKGSNAYYYAVAVGWYCIAAALCTAFFVAAARFGSKAPEKDKQQ